jgi:hypothetical protein
MGLFGKRDDVPETISNEDYASLQRRAAKANTESMFSRKMVDRRIASNEQQQKKHLS